MKLAPPQESELFFELGGPVYRLMQRIGVIKGAGPSIGRRSVAFIAVTWLPLLLFTALEGHAIGPTPRSSFLLDFATYARFFLGVPLVFAAERVVGPRIRAAGLRFIEADIVRPESCQEFEAAVARVRRRREALLPEAVFAFIALFGAWFFSIERLAGLDITSWHTTWLDGTLRLSAAGLWYNFVAVPLVQFFVLRWLWRLVIWTLFLGDVSRLRLNLLATHADMAAGLGFLGIAHVSMAIFPLAAGCVLSAEVAFRVRFEGLDLAALQSMVPLLIAYLVFVEAVTFGPLLIFVPLLVRTRLEGLRSYGILVQRHNQLFHRKWIEGERQADELPLGSQDMSSLIDLGSSYAVIRQMNAVPVSRTQLLQVAVVTCLPALPLVFLVLPFAEVLKLLAGVIR
ncbi:hypothetical protein [Limobrevibacterium gyesilva]|uniref:Uncharacterized protein n=1 Tax=Limobrevibacterium gyesilva TaxID=2991712 RepID=A0AA41YPZ6_9PROT|nr:hypothetical protein [Limobrevibacterium gyesilva]MCW3476591.1 hypothetical protein [Limobrevibacterium gyesilva]